ncbi:TetR/AcrR family transcriptional regulator [Celeribacter indicus]|uniref:TetR family transcriptional regulator n=1 Tax=Celeribacter indicus TaxID=1208324 RepID=A0A0B5DUI3_9RHOB|nr:TetR/AcrR family transcriptional regulator [Celeribacter indicus]AJE47093.1 TetR family transcriptional regulator [Celeribacter indicus]SDW91099.1 transcriptional regulator, TetR family [Celeribacter indicus]
MTQQHRDTSSRPPGRDRVLTAAITCFSRALYAEVSLREVATLADVDVAYVHRSFGSKAELFRAALDELLRIEALFALPCTPGEMIERMSVSMISDRSDDGSQARALDLILQSCTSAEPRDILREAVEQHFLPPLAAVFGAEKKVAVSFGMSLLLGVSILREAMQIEPIASLSQDEVRQISAGILRTILDGDPPAP